MPPIADTLLKNALSDVGVSEDATPSDKYAAITEIVAALEKMNKSEKIIVGTTGTITDRICGWALASVGGDFEYRLTGRNTKWLGDYALLGFPLNLIISVKSFKAKERLLMSGTGSQLVPTIGFGLFDDANEFNSERLVSYRMRGFLAIYMPEKTLNETAEEARDFANWNGTRLLRSLPEFPENLRGARIHKVMGDEKRVFIDPLMI